MKIAFMVATRGNPRRAAAVIECARSLAGDDNMIEYLVGIDADDKGSIEYFEQNDMNVLLSIADRPAGVGAVWNRLCRMIDADIYVPFPDDSFIATPHWDDGIVYAMNMAFNDKRVGALAWNDLANPNQCSLPIVTREWLELTGDLYDERFPFWFYDTCVNEVWSFVTGRPIVIVKPLILAARKGLTKRMRDVSFWWDFYVHTRPERMRKAAVIRERLGIELPDETIKAVLLMWWKRDEVGRAAIPEIEKQLPERGPSDATYLDAFAEAQDIMRAA